MLVAERLVERVRVRSAVRCVEHQHFAASGARLLLERLHQELADAAAAEALADHEPGYLDAGLVTFDEVLHVENPEPGDFSLQLGDDEPGRRVVRDPLDPFRSLLRVRRVAELAEKGGDCGRVPGLRFAKRYGGGGGGGASGGGPSSSTYVVLLRAHPPP